MTVDTGTYSYLMDDIRSLSWTILTPKPRNLLTSLGVKKGDRVSTMLPRTTTLLAVIVGAWRIGAVYQPLFTAFGVEAIEYRLQKAATNVVFTDSHNREKFNDINPLLLTSTKYNRLTEKQCKYKIIPFWSQAARQV